MKNKIVGIIVLLAFVMIGNGCKLFGHKHKSSFDVTPRLEKIEIEKVSYKWKDETIPSDEGGKGDGGQSCGTKVFKRLSSSIFNSTINPLF